jgi:hypothetical protein
MTLALIELKWLLEPVTIREIITKDDELLKGIEQVQEILKYSHENMSILSQRAFNESHLPVRQMWGTVISRNVVGTVRIRHESVPVVEMSRFLFELDRANGDLSTLGVRLMDKGDVPQVGIDYEEKEVEFDYAGYHFVVPAFEFKDSSGFIEWEKTPPGLPVHSPEKVGCGLRCD